MEYQPNIYRDITLGQFVNLPFADEQTSTGILVELADAAGLINIEREADLSGNTHNKGVLILGGYLRKKYAQDKPITMSASIAFEQSYSGVDGDSASSTEIYALLSSLSGRARVGTPVRQMQILLMLINPPDLWSQNYFQF